MWARFLPRPLFSRLICEPTSAAGKRFRIDCLVRAWNKHGTPKSLRVGSNNPTERKKSNMMSIKYKLVVALCGAALTAFPALCQENMADKSDVSVQGFLPVV